MDAELDDDDMVVVIIGDDDYEDTPTTEMEVTVKQEPLDESEVAPVEEILETIAKHGEFIEIKKEIEEYDEYEKLEEEDEDCNPGDPSSNSSVEEEEDDDYVEVKKSTYKRKPWRKERIFGPRPNWRRHKPFSYVQQLRDENPEFREHPSKLIDHLADIMRKLRPPRLPDDVVHVNCEDGKVTFVCSKCEVEKYSLGAGKRHYQRFHGDFYLMCYACGIKFTNSTNLYKHEKNCKARDAAVVLKARGLYLGVKGRGRPFCTDHKFRPGGDPVDKPKGRLYCSQCPASFAHKGNLEAHELAHAGERPYRCNLCPVAYTSDVALKRHLATHGDYRFICDDCGKRFKLKPLLVSHMNVHRPLAKFPCPECPRRFARRTTMQQHHNRKHLQLPHQHACPVCTKRYARIAHVRDHLKKVHGLAMITRSMFLQNLPKMSNISLQEAKIVLKQENGGCVMLPAIPDYTKPATKDEKEVLEIEFEEDEEEDIKLEKDTNDINVQYVIKEEKATPNKNRFQSQTDVPSNEMMNDVEVKYEMPEEDEELVESMASFLRTIQNVKPGTKVVSVQKTKPKTQYLKPPDNLPIPYQPRVKVYYQNDYS